MTYIQSKRSDYQFNLVIILLMSTVVLTAFYLIMIYSRTVNLSNEIRAQQTALKSVMIESAEIKNQIFSQVTDVFLKTRAAELGLVEDKNPTYFELQKQWLFASQ